MQNPSSYRTLAPASSSSSTSPSGKVGKGSAKGVSSKKRTPVPIACTNCQKRKSKCSGQRPACSSCESKGLECHYDIKDTLPALRNTAQELTTRVQEYERLLLLIRTSNSLNEVHGHLDAFQAAQETTKRAIDVDEAAQQAGFETSTLTSPSSSAASISPETAKPGQQFSSSTTTLGQWNTLQQARDSTAVLSGSSRSQGQLSLQDRSTQIVNVELFGHLPMSCSSLVTSYPVSTGRQQAAKVLVPEYLVQPLWCSDQSPLNKVYVEYCEAARQMIADGTPAEDILGLDFVSVDLFFRDRQPTDAFNVCSWACEVSKGFYMIDVKIRLALASLFTHLMRWMLDPNPDTFARVPHIIRPTPCQRLIPHPPMIDLVVTPPLREALCRKFRDWASVMEQHVHFDWPFAFEECFEFDPTTGRNTKLTSRFEDHVADMENWSFDSAVFEEFPELLGQVKMYEQTFEVPER